MLSTGTDAFAEGVAVDPLDTVRARLVNQRLAGIRCDNVEDAVGWLGAVQAQEYAEAKWSLAQRLTGHTDTTIESAIDRGEIIRTHALRPTWHFLASSDARWILRLTRKRVHALNAYWYRKAELDGALFARADDVFAQSLADGGSRTRAELAHSLRAAGIEASGQRLAYLLMHAELEELLCNGPRRARQHTYSLFDDRVPIRPGDDRTDVSALDELLFRYVSSHGPTTVRDFASWSSLPVRDIRAALERCGDGFGSATDENGTAWYFVPQAASGRSHAERLTEAFLLPMYDEMIVAYQDLRVVPVAPLPRADVIERAIVVDGFTVGTWKRSFTGRTAVLDATMLRPLTRAEGTALDDALGRFSTFIGMPVALETTVV